MKPPFDFEELWLLLEEATYGVWKWDIDADEVAWSPKLCETLGVDAPNAYAGLAAVLHPDDRERHDATVTRYVEAPGIYTLDARARFADGEYHWITIRGVAERDDAGRATKMLGWVIDLSEERAKVDASARGERLLETFLDACPAAVFIKDVESRILYVNDTAARIVGTPVEEIRGTRTEDLWPETGAELRADDQQVLETGVAKQWDATLPAKDGKTRYVLGTKFPFTDLSSGEMRLAGFALDTTEVQEARQRTEAAQRLESLGVLAGGIAHDFNNLLMVILGNAELARAEPASAPSAAEQIIDVARKASDICRELLAYAGDQSIAMQTISLEEVARASAELLHMSVVGGPELTTTVAPSAPTVSADPSQLQRVLVNLVLNAKEAGSRNVAIVFDSATAIPDDEGACVRSSLSGEESRLGRIAVVDDGEGIPADQLERVFEPFHTSKDAGSGLGLSAVHGVVRRHGGAIRLCSQPGETRFEIYLPASAPSHAAAPTEEAAALPLAGKHLLIVDDEPMIARVTTRLLELRGIAVDTADSGFAALERLATESERFDAVLLDLSMPGMSGTEVLRRLRSDFPELPVIVSSGFGRDAIEGGLRRDREAFLPKPYTGDELDRALSIVLQD